MTPREIALKSGAAFYQSGRDCPSGHPNPIRYACGNCVICAKATAERRRASDAAGIKEGKKAYYAANQERIKAKARAWSAANKDRRGIATRGWAVLNADKMRVYSRAYRARAAGSEGSHSSADVLFLYKSQRGKCVYCAALLHKKYHVDHIFPLKLGGGNGRQNIQLVCKSCNSQKGYSHPVVFAQRKGLLL